MSKEAYQRAKKNLQNLCCTGKPLLRWDVTCPHCDKPQPEFEAYINLPLGISGCVCRDCVKAFRIKGESIVKDAVPPGSKEFRIL